MGNELNHGILLQAVCTQCGARIQVDPGKEAGICPYCGAPFSVSRALQEYADRYPSPQPDNSPMRYAPSPQEKKYYEEPVRKKKRHTFWWILGWLFIFPVPLTILMLRNRKLGFGLRMVILLAGWAVFAFLGMRGREVQTEHISASGRPVITETVREEPVITPSVRPVSTPEQAPAEAAAVPEETEANAEQALEPTEVPAGTVTPEFKAAMDSYEAFFDEYAEFMESFSDSSADAMTLIKYASFMAQYAETMEALDAIDETQLSPADDAYYIEVMARINVKLLQTAQAMG